MAVNKQAVSRIINLDKVKTPEIKFSLQGKEYTVKEPGVTTYFSILERQNELNKLQLKEDETISSEDISKLRIEIMQFQLDMINLLVSPGIPEDVMADLSLSQIKKIMEFVNQVQNAMSGVDEDEDSEGNAGNPDH